MPLFQNEKVWRILANFWTLVLAIFLIANFFSRNSYDFLTPTFSIIYTGVLSLYVGTKEFERWYDIHDGRHPGEWFVIGWTVLIFLLLIAGLLLGKDYNVSPEIIADYIMVLSVFAVTQKSKRLYAKRRGKK